VNLPRCEISLGELHLSDEEARTLVAVREQGAINNAMYQKLNRVDTLGANQSLRRLRDAGLLEQKGRGSGTYYQPTQRLLGDDEDALALSSNLPALSSNPGGLSSNLGGLSSNPHWAGLPENLRPLVSAGVLAYTQPNVPNHPHQAYRAVEGAGATA
jgi:ATP-dependent DNA helicase RecG